MKSRKYNVVICPPCGESVAMATKEGQNRKNALPRLTAVLHPQGREMSKGFTLIELLVVILIIGILAAVALPQYQKAVAKARAVQMLQIATDIRKAEEIYFLENGKYTTALENLSISYVIPSQVRINITLQTQTTPDAVRVFDDRLPGISFYFGFYHTTFNNWAGRRSCYAEKTNEAANLLCTQLTGERKRDSGSVWWVYLF